MQNMCNCLFVTCVHLLRPQLRIQNDQIVAILYVLFCFFFFASLFFFIFILIHKTPRHSRSFMTFSLVILIFLTIINKAHTRTNNAQKRTWGNSLNYITFTLHSTLLWSVTNFCYHSSINRYTLSYSQCVWLVHVQNMPNSTKTL